MKTFKLKIIFIAWMIGAFLVSLTYLLLHTKLVFYDLIFWTGIILSGITTFIVISSDEKIYTKLCFLFLFGLVLYIPHVLSSPNHFHIYDEMNHYQSSSLVYESGNPNVNSAFALSKYYPTLEILIAFFKNITGDSIFASGLIIVSIIHSLAIIFLYFFLRNICSAKIASIGAFVYFFNSGYTYTDTYVSYESIGFPLLVICLFAISYNYGNKIRFMFIQYILIFGLVATHHFSSYMLLLFLVILLFLKRKEDHDDIYRLTIFTAALIFAWVTYVAPKTLNYYYDILHTSSKGVIGLMLFKERVSEVLSSSFLDVPYYELFIRRYLYVPLILILILIGIYYLKNKKKLDAYALTMIIFSTLFFISLIGTMTSSFEISRFSTFGFIGVSLFIGASINKFNKKIFLRFLAIILVILLLIGGVSLGTSSPYRGSYSNNIRVGQSTITADSISSATWSETYAGRYNTFASDQATGAVLEYYGMQRVITNWEIFYPPTVDKSVLYHLRYNNASYLATDIRITKFISELRYYFNIDELYLNESYGRTKPFPENLIKKFDNNEMFLKIYDNGNINIYNIVW
jgi:hypothetical protein